MKKKKKRKDWRKKRGKEREESAGKEKFLTDCMWPPAGTLFL